MPRKARRKPKKKANSTPSEELIKHNPNAAGIDVGSEEMFVCVPEGRDEPNIRSFESFTSDLTALAQWLKQCGVETVAIESTGSYWIPLYELLEESGFEVYLVNPHELKKTKKTDVIDCAWLQQMHSYGLLARSFRPSDEICALRTLVRHRDNLIRYRAAHVLHMQKALHEMNIKLDNVISDITGTTGLTIIRAILAGERDLDVLASYRDSHCKNSVEVIRKSLEGNYKSEHLFALRQAVEFFDFYSTQILNCDQEMENYYIGFTDRTGGSQPPTTSKNTKPNRNDPPYNLREYLRRLCGVDLTAIHGIGALTVQTLVTECGIDMSKFPTVKHWTAWLHLAPNNRISGRKLLRPRTTTASNRAGQALREAARSLHHSNSWLGNYYRRMKSIHGPAKANKLTAHKIARIIYFMLINREEYDETLYQKYENKRQDKVIASLQRKAKQFGLALVPAIA